MTFSAEIKLREEGFTLTLQETRSRLHEKKFLNEYVHQFVSMRYRL